MHTPKLILDCYTKLGSWRWIILSHGTSSRTHSAHVSSPSKQKLVIRFGDPEHGLLSVDVQAGVHAWHAPAVSDVLGDSLLMLAEAGLALLEGRTEAEVTWFLEPSEVLWRWTKIDDLVEFSILEPSYNVFNKQCQNVFTMVGTVEDLFFPVWRALRSLESNAYWTSDLRQQSHIWSNPFPHQATQQLGEKLKGR